MHQALTTEDPIRPNSATVHADAVSAVAVSCAALREAGGPTLVASASASAVAVYALDLERRALDLVAAGPPPQALGERGGAALAAVEFSPDGRHLSLFGADGALAVLRLPPGAPDAEELDAEANGSAAEAEAPAAPAPAPAPVCVLALSREAAMEHSGASARRARGALRQAVGHYVLSPNKGGVGGGLVLDAQGAFLGPPPPAATGVWVWWRGANAVCLFALDLEIEGSEGPATGAAACAPVRSFVTPYEVTCSDMSSDGAMLATGLRDGTVLLWSTHLGIQEGAFERLPTAAVAVAFTRGGARALVAAAASGEVRRHAHSGGAVGGGVGLVQGALGGALGSLALLGNGSVVAARLTSGRLQLYDAAAGALLLADIVPPPGYAFTGRAVGPSTVAEGEPTLVMLATPLPAEEEHTYTSAAEDAAAEGQEPPATAAEGGDASSSAGASAPGEAGSSEVGGEESAAAAGNGASTNTIVLVYHLLDYIPDTLVAEPPVMVERELHEPMLVPVPPSTAPGVATGTTPLPAVPAGIIAARRRHLTTAGSRPATGLAMSMSSPRPRTVPQGVALLDNDALFEGAEGAGGAVVAAQGEDMSDPADVITSILRRMQGRRGGRYQRERRIAKRKTELLHQLTQEAAEAQ